MRIDFEFKPEDLRRRHTDSRLCALESIRDSRETGRYAEVVAVCTCGRRKEYFAGEVDGYIFVCSGGVILKYYKDNAKTFNFNQVPEDHHMRVLFVEDEPLIQRIWRDMLEGTGIVGEIESDGDAAFRRYCDDGPFDLVLTDTKHTGMSGADLVAAINKKDPKQAVSILKKPVHKEELLKFIESFRKAC